MSDTNKQRPFDQEFPLSYNAYAAFDAQSLKLLMQQRLTENGVFTDQIFEGSNFNNLLDVVAYSYNVLLYYLNQTSNESLFSNVTLYENMSKIVKLLNYKPIGLHSSVLSFQAEANELLEPGVYTIPRFSYFTVNDIIYSVNNDLTFVKSSTGVETLNELSDFSLLYQGEFIEYPIYVSTGENFEEVNIVSVDSDGNNEPIDHSNFYVFVRNETGKWREWKRVESLYLQNGSNECFEVRLNENQRYTVKFGNSVTGKKLIAGNLVAIYYLRSDKDSGFIGPNTLDNNKMFFYSTEQYNAIVNDIRDAKTRLITLEEVSNINFTNTEASSPYSDVETVAQIRQNAPNTFRQQNRLVTIEDFESYIHTNFGNILTDVKVVNNWDYLDEHIRYLYNIGLKEPSLDSRVLLNQVRFADSCNFNNIYIYGIPKKLITNNFTFDRGFLSEGIKDYILNKINALKMSTTEIVFQDPVFFAVGFGVATQEEIFNNNLTTDIVKQSKLVVSRSASSNLSISEIKNQIKQTILDYFSFSNTRLGQEIDLQLLTQQIYNLGGVKNIFTTRDGVVTPGLNLLGFNPVYNFKNEDIGIIAQNTKLPFFKIPYWYDVSGLDSQIEVISSDYLINSKREY